MPALDIIVFSTLDDSTHRPNAAGIYTLLFDTDLVVRPPRNLGPDDLRALRDGIEAFVREYVDAGV